MDKPYIGIGIDPSLTDTGLVAVTSYDDIPVNLSVKSKKNGDLPINEVNRIVSLANEVYIKTQEASQYGHTPVVAMEGLAFMARNSCALVQLAALNYMLRRRLMIDWNVPTVIVAPSSLKKFISGKGNCQKSLMFMETYKRWGVEFTNDNLMDAHGLARIALALSTLSEEGLTNPQKEVINLLRKQTDG